MAFYRSLGYRRVGNSSCFALPLDRSHPAYGLTPSQEFEPVDPVISTDEDEGDEEQWGWDREKKNLERIQRLLPLHHAIVTLPDAQCLTFLKALEFSTTDARWLKTNQDLNNALHTAATNLKPQTVQWLLDNIEKTHKLSLVRNIDGLTPLEAAQDFLEIKRTQREYGMMTLVMSDLFAGFGDAAVQVVLALKSLSTLTDKELECIKFGCTCGECLGGFLSPRMCFAMKCQGEIGYDMLNDDMNDDSFWLLMHGYMTENVAADIKQNFRTNKSLRQGYTNLFQRIAACIERKEVPTSVNVIRRLQHYNDEWPPCTKNFLQRGRKVEDALKTIFEFARDQDQFASDGSAWDTFADDFEKLTSCRNDHEFGFAALNCGVQNL